MENRKQVGGGGSGSSSSSSSFTNNLFGPRESSNPPTSSSPAGLFGSVFGPPPSSGQRRDSSMKQDSGSQYGNGKHGTSGNDIAKRREGEGNKPGEPCYFSSSIYYGAQDVYSPNGQPTISEHVDQFKKDGGDEDGASRGNWWQGSLYY